MTNTRGNYYTYARISTKEEADKQTFARQDKAFKTYAEENKIEYFGQFKDDCTGSTFDRKDWLKLEKGLRAGDTIIFKEISRFTRQAEKGLEKYMELYKRGINLIFLDNPTINTDYIKQLGAVAEQQDLIIRKSIENVIELLLIVELDRVEKEREIIVKRIKQGIEASEKKQGRKTGQLDKMTDSLRKDIQSYKTDRKIKIVDLLKKHKISRNTFYKYLEAAE